MVGILPDTLSSYAYLLFTNFEKKLRFGVEPVAGDVVEF
jgi:hypothetical protein